MPVVPQLLDAVAANPDDDVPRLVLADAVVDLGFGWGELIRIQLLLARGAPNAAALREEEAKLLAVLEPRLHRAMLPWADHCLVRRGVPEVAYGSAESMLGKHQGPSTLRAAVLRAGHTELPLLEVLAHPVVQRLEALSLTVREGAQVGPSVSAVPLPRLRWLEVAGTCEPSDLARLLTAFPLSQLESLTVARTAPGRNPRAATALLAQVAAQPRPKLRRLCVEGFTVDDSAAVKAVLVACPVLETFGFLRGDTPQVAEVLAGSTLAEVEATDPPPWTGGPRLVRTGGWPGGPRALEKPERPRRVGPYPLHALIDVDGFSAYLSEAEQKPVVVVVRRAVHDGEAARQGYPVLAPRFVAAARRAELRAHPAVLRTLGWGLDGCDAWQAVELCDGAPLLALGAEPLAPSRELLALFAIVAEAALACANDSENDLWRRVRRRSVYVERDGRVRLLSEWLPSVLGDTVRASAMVLAPEVLKGHPQQLPSAAWGLGALAWELLTGSPLASGRMSEVAKQIIQGGLTPLEHLGPGLPKELVVLVDSLLEVDPEARPTLAEAATRFRELVNTVPSSPELPARAAAAVDASPLHLRLRNQFGLWPSWRQPAEPFTGGF